MLLNMLFLTKLNGRIIWPTSFNQAMLAMFIKTTNFHTYSVTEQENEGAAGTGVY